MIIEILDYENNVITKISGVLNPEQEFNEHYKEMYNSAGWRIVGQELPKDVNIQQQKIMNLNKQYREKFKVNDEAYIIALRNNDTALVEELNSERQSLQNKYNMTLEAIRNE